MSQQYDATMEDYDYYRHTGELSDYFEDDDDECEETLDDDDECEETLDDFVDGQIIGEEPIYTDNKLKHLNKLTEVYDEAATEYGVEMKNFTFRNNNGSLTLYTEFISIAGKRHKGTLTIKAVLYDKDGDILETETGFIESQTFKGFEVLDFLFLNSQPSDIGRIVIYMQ